MSISLLALKNLKSYYSYFIEIDRKERQLVNSYKKCRRGIGYCIYLHCLYNSFATMYHNEKRGFRRKN